MMKESDILYERGAYWVCAEQFGSGRLRPKSNGFAVYRAGLTHSVRVMSVGFSGERGLQRAIDEANKRADAK